MSLNDDDEPEISPRTVERCFRFRVFPLSTVKPAALSRIPLCPMPMPEKPEAPSKTLAHPIVSASKSPGSLELRSGLRVLISGFRLWGLGSRVPLELALNLEPQHR